jgi:hypothetical protein
MTEPKQLRSSKPSDALCDSRSPTLRVVPDTCILKLATFPEAIGRVKGSLRRCAPLTRPCALPAQLAITGAIHLALLRRRRFAFLSEFRHQRLCRQEERCN